MMNAETAKTLFPGIYLSSAVSGCNNMVCWLNKQIQKPFISVLLEALKQINHLALRFHILLGFSSKLQALNY